MQMMMMGPGTTPTVIKDDFAHIVLFVRSVYDTADQIVQIESSLDALAPFTTGGAAWNTLPTDATTTLSLDDPAQVPLDPALQA